MLMQQLLEQLAAAVEAEAQRRAEELFRARVSSLLDNVRGAGSAIPERSVPEPAVPAKQGSTSSTRKPMTCSKCGAVGFTATTCGKTHNVSTSPAVGPIAIPRPAQETSPPATPSIKLVDRKPPPPQQAPAPIVSLPSRRPHSESTFDPAEDRREEFRELSDLHRKYR